MHLSVDWFLGMLLSVNLLFTSLPNFPRLRFEHYFATSIFDLPTVYARAETAANVLPSGVLRTELAGISGRTRIRETRFDPPEGDLDLRSRLLA